METFTYKKIKSDNYQLDLKFNIYRSLTELKGVVLYFHGGGLLYGSRADLPDLHKERLTSSGYTILSFDYRLAPEAKFQEILSDVKDAISFFLNNREKLELSTCPYFLWGRSAGSYLSLLASTMNFETKVKGVVSFYGYGFTIDSWFSTPSIFYLKYPKVEKESMERLIEDFPLAEGDINKRFLIYLYARQTGRWLPMITDQYLPEFLNKYSLKTVKGDLPPVFFAYSYKDTDVPFRESIELQKLFKDHSTFTTSVDAHDFDRDEKSNYTIRLLDKTVEFLDSNI